MIDGTEALLLIVIPTVAGLIFALSQYFKIAEIELEQKDERQRLVIGKEGGNEDSFSKLVELNKQIKEGAEAFLQEEYTVCSIFIFCFAILVFVLTSRHGDEWDFTIGGVTALCYVCGAVVSMICGYIGMMIAVFSNARTTLSAAEGWSQGFNTAFRAGIVAGFFLVSFGVLMFYTLIQLINLQYPFSSEPSVSTPSTTTKLFECITGFGLGASTIALFGRVGGGIYTKAADVGADLAGKVIQGLPEDDARNPATIADNVGDNVGDVAGMSADLFGSLAEATCAALVVSITSVELLSAGWGAILYPLILSASGIIVSALTALIALYIQRVDKENDIDLVLKVQLAVSSLLMIVVCYIISVSCLPDTFILGEGNNTKTVNSQGAFFCVISGVIAGCLIGFITEYYTSHSYGPVQEVAESCKTGAATNIIFGLSLGYKSAIVPVIILAFCIYESFSLAGMYGVALAALGMLATLPTSLAIDVYGPVCDNAGGIAEMAGYPAEVREKTDALDSAGNTTAAIGKGFAIGSAAFVSLALFGAFVTRINQKGGVDILQPITFAGLFVGGMLPYWFTAMTMKSVGLAAKEMVLEVKRQFETIPGLLEGTGTPDSQRCIKIATDASLKEMIYPAILVIFTPIITGGLFGVHALQGVLVGSLISGVQLAVSQSNSGGAWDNAKKYIEKGALSDMIDGNLHVWKKGTDVHKAAVVGDTVGDPFKDTSGPALNILMKLMAIISLVFADFFMGINEGHGAFNI